MPLIRPEYIYTPRTRPHIKSIQRRWKIVGFQVPRGEHLYIDTDCMVKRVSVDGAPMASGAHASRARFIVASKIRHPWGQVYRSL